MNSTIAFVFVVSTQSLPGRGSSARNGNQKGVRIHTEQHLINPKRVTNEIAGVLWPNFNPVFFFIYNFFFQRWCSANCLIDSHHCILFCFVLCPKKKKCK